MRKWNRLSRPYGAANNFSSKIFIMSDLKRYISRSSKIHKANKIPSQRMNSTVYESRTNKYKSDPANKPIDICSGGKQWAIP